MVHRIFKGMVPHTNRKIVELDLTRRYNTIDALRLIIDGWKDPRFTINTKALSNLTKDPHLYEVFSNWYAIESPLLYLQDEENESSGK